MLEDWQYKKQGFKRNYCSACKALNNPNLKALFILNKDIFLLATNLLTTIIKLSFTFFPAPVLKFPADTANTFAQN